MRTADFLALEGFHPRLLPHYASDYEFTIRARRKGLKLVCDPRLSLLVDESTSGYHRIEETEKSFFRMLKKKFFSVKTPANPFYWTAFILLACPWRWKLLNILRIWFGTMKSIAYLCKLRIVK
jgi:GT2 family glycosyltransferase